MSGVTLENPKSGKIESWSVWYSKTSRNTTELKVCRRRIVFSVWVNRVKWIASTKNEIKQIILFVLVYSKDFSSQIYFNKLALGGFWFYLWITYVYEFEMHFQFSFCAIFDLWNSISSQWIRNTKSKTSERFNASFEYQLRRKYRTIHWYSRYEQLHSSRN